MIIGADNIALEQTPSAEPDNYFPVHTYLFAEAGVTILEVLNLEELARDRVAIDQKSIRGRSEVD